MRRIDEDIKSGQFKNLYLLYGTEDYLKIQYKNKLIHALVNDGDTMNFTQYIGKKGYNNKDGEIIDLAETMPFFGKTVGPDEKQYRVILMDGCGLGKKGSTKGDLLEYFDSIPEHTIFIVVENEADKNRKLYKIAKKLGRDIEIKMPNEDILARWVGAKLKAANKKIKTDAWKKFLLMTHANMSNMEMELEKLISYTGDREQITIEDVDAICIAGIESRVFDITDAITAKDLKKTLDIYNELLVTRISPREILAQIISLYRKLRVIKELDEYGDSMRSIAEKLGNNEYYVKMNLPRARRLSKGEINSLLTDAIDYTYKMNNGFINEKVAVELIMMKYAGEL